MKRFATMILALIVVAALASTGWSADDKKDAPSKKAQAEQAKKAETKKSAASAGQAATVAKKSAAAKLIGKRSFKKGASPHVMRPVPKKLKGFIDKNKNKIDDRRENLRQAKPAAKKADPKKAKEKKK